VIKNNDLITEKIIGCCYNVHNELGPGLNERIYQNALKLEFDKLNIAYEEEKKYKVFYQKKSIGELRVDLIVDNKVIIELKAISGYVPKVFEDQVISYLQISKLDTGLIINFGNKSCQVRRLVRKSQ
jgi:GxxExxY protein